ncbi:hypothetical protein MKQ70_17555 [Chitinophaga sedimenti]|uniref:hypothetical protein n=1 Tax=Chitinophaga sedimenti TaxID=2033606 RepID=UPI0020047FC8|nr:hypothetical protein [Chitinophaga sedimenti]MCK7556727.1 hypothetical protein [Chitinophaga sedimenti]
MKLNLRKIKPTIFAATLATLVVATHLPSNGNRSAAVATTTKTTTTVTTRASAMAALYDQLSLDSAGLSKEAFDYALAGYEQLGER